MAPKRSLEQDEESVEEDFSTVSTPTKRQRTGRRSSASSIFNPYNPHTPYSPLDFPVPADSPTNPFGRVRHRRRRGDESVFLDDDDEDEETIKYLKLPPPTPFAEHLALRFQLVRKRAVTETDTFESHTTTTMPFRIVQVPLNYSFRHVHKLVEYLFGGVNEAPEGALHKKAQRVKKRPPGHSARLSKSSSLESRYRDQHLFEILYQMRMFGHPAKPKPPPVIESVSLASVAFAARTKSRVGLLDSSPAASSSTLLEEEDEEETEVYPWTQGFGTVQTAKTRIRLSTALNPFCKHEEAEFRDVASEIYGCDYRVYTENSNEAVKWTWDLEEDLTLGHTWPNGGNLARGVVYHHSPDIQVHITINTVPVPGRKGSGNTPFVFVARGSSAPFIHWARTSVPIADEEDRTDGGPFMHGDLWNRSGGFEQFLATNGEASPMKTLQRSKSSSSIRDDVNSSSLPLPPSESPTKLRYPAATPFPGLKMQKVRQDEATRRMRIVELNKLDFGSEHRRNASDSEEEREAVLPTGPLEIPQSSRVVRTRRKSLAFGEPDVIVLNFDQDDTDAQDDDVVELNSDEYGNVDGYNPFYESTDFSGSPVLPTSSSPGLTDDAGSSSPSSSSGPRTSSSPTKFSVGSSPLKSTSAAVKFALDSPLRSSSPILGSPIDGALWANKAKVPAASDKEKKKGIKFGISSRPLFDVKKKVARTWDPFVDA